MVTDVDNRSGVKVQTKATSEATWPIQSRLKHSENKARFTVKGHVSAVKHRVSTHLSRGTVFHLQNVSSAIPFPPPAHRRSKSTRAIG